MTMTQPEKPQEDLKRHKLEVLDNLVGEQVMHTLGTPGNFLTVQVSMLWKNRYRVNVYVGPDVASARVAHSYFLVVDGEGTILASTPKIASVYGPD